MPPNEQHQRALIAEICRGDQHAMQELYGLHAEAVLSFLLIRLDNRALAEEALQEVMLAVWRGACRFRGECAVRTWLLSIAVHKAANLHQKRRPQQQALDDRLPDWTQIEALDTADDMSAIQATINQLPAAQIEALDLIFYHELSASEAASLLGVPLGTVKTRLYRALHTLRQLIRREEIDHV